jgi:hypothetical protein
MLSSWEVPNSRRTIVIQRGNGEFMVMTLVEKGGYRIDIFVLGLAFFIVRFGLMLLNKYFTPSASRKTPPWPKITYFC